MSLDSAGEALFGFDFHHLEEVSNPGIDAMDYVINEIFSPLRVAFPLMNRLPLASNRMLKQSMGLLDQLVMDMISTIQADKNAITMTNVLEILLRGQKKGALNAVDLRNNIIALVLASHETTQVSLTATLYYLAKYPAYQAQLRAEMYELFPNLTTDFMTIGHESGQRGRDSVYRKLQTFHSMGHFILESLRLYSPLANQNPRTTSQDTTLGGYHLPKGTVVIMNIHAIHMNEAEFNEPTQFDPTRFHKGNCPNKFAYLPFGAGPRLCSGRMFSLIEQKVVLCHLLHHFDFALPNEGYTVPIRRGSFTGLPKDDFQLTLRPRLKKSA